MTTRENVPADPSDSSPAAGDGVTAEMVQAAIKGYANRKHGNGTPPIFGDSTLGMRAAILATGLPDELAKLRAQVGELKGSEKLLAVIAGSNRRQITELTATLAERDAQIADVRKDAERLDWLAQNCFINEYSRRKPYAMLRIYTKHTPTRSEYFQCADRDAVGLISVRTAIDTAIAAQKDKP